MVGGLLGNFDYEAYNDLMLPNGDVQDRLRRFLNAWEVDSSCRSTQMYLDDKPAKSTEQCKTVFDSSSSSLRPCFLAVSLLLELFVYSKVLTYTYTHVFLREHLKWP